MQRQSSCVKELFHEDAQGSHSQAFPWWKVKVFVWEPVLFGTWDGVFTTCMINIFGVVLFLRTGWLVGNTGVLLGLLLVSLVILVALVTVMCGIGVCERCRVGDGGVYSMISTVLGGRVGGTVGLLYVFGQCVAGAMYITGFAESITQTLGLQSTWAVRGFSVAVLLSLVCINLAGVKWIVRLQLLLLAILAVSTVDFVVGSFSHLDIEHGFVGYSEALLRKNARPDYTPGETFFTVFGVFFPAATGVMAGFNMNSDLQKPEHNIPVGTLAAVLISWFLYLVFVFLLGAICTREALRYDFLIAEKVSLVGFLFLSGLYISSLASCMGGLYGAPRILQCITQERVIPVLSFLGETSPNKTPVAAIFLTSLITMAFIFIGQVNVLAPIVTINFMLTYSIIDYSYFCVAMAYDLKSKERKHQSMRRTSLHNENKHLMKANSSDYGSDNAFMNQANGTLLEFTKDMNQIFHSAKSQHEDVNKAVLSARSRISGRQTLINSFGFVFGQDVPSDRSDNLALGVEDPENSTSETQQSALDAGTSSFQSRSLCAVGFTDVSYAAECIELIPKHPSQVSEIGLMPRSCYSKFCSRWIALIGALCCLMIMFVIQWVYALANIVIAILLFLYIGQASPGLPPGVATCFGFFRWMKLSLKSFGRPSVVPEDQIVVTPSLSMLDMETQQVTEDNADFSWRGRYHCSSIISVHELA